MSKNTSQNDVQTAYLTFLTAFVDTPRLFLLPLYHESA